MAATSTYKPGVCNIGPDEIAKREKSGWFGLIGLIGLWGLLVILNASQLWYLLVFFPATMAASGFLQAYLHFCAGFGLKGVYNVVKPAGQTETIGQQDMRAKDRRKAFQIVAGSALIGCITALIAYSVAG